ncbi:hypothetical protein D3C85_974970 [compost metagenome]
MDVVTDADALFHLVGAQHAVGAGDGAQLHAGDHRGAAGFVPHDVAVVAEDHFVAALAVGVQRQLVAEVAGRHEQRGFLAEDACGQRFQLAHGGVVAVDVVADHGVEHGLAHGEGGLGYGVAADVKHGHGGLQ